MNDCLFCKIITGEIPVNNKIYDDEDVIGLLDINPMSYGHTLVIPKIHSENILKIKDTEYQKTLSVVKKLAGHLKKKLKSDGILLHVDGRDIPHTHIHIIPRYGKTDLELLKNTTSYTENDLEKYTKLLKQK